MDEERLPLQVDSDGERQPTQIVSKAAVLVAVAIFTAGAVLGWEVQPQQPATRARTDDVVGQRGRSDDPPANPLHNPHPGDPLDGAGNIDIVELEKWYKYEPDQAQMLAAKTQRETAGWPNIGLVSPSSTELKLAPFGAVAVRADNKGKDIDQDDVNNNLLFGDKYWGTRYAALGDNPSPRRPQSSLKTSLDGSFAKYIGMVPTADDEVLFFATECDDMCSIGQRAAWLHSVCIKESFKQRFAELDMKKSEATKAARAAWEATGKQWGFLSADGVLSATPAPSPDTTPKPTPAPVPTPVPTPKPTPAPRVPVFEQDSELSFPADGPCALQAEGAAADLPLDGMPYTIEAWVKPESGAQGIVGWGEWGHAGKVNGFRFGGGQHPHVLKNYWWGNDMEKSFDALDDGAWHHVAVSFDGRYQMMFVDFRRVNSRVAAGYNVKKKDNFCVGRTNGHEVFKGKIRELKIWNMARYGDCRARRGAMAGCKSELKE